MCLTSTLVLISKTLCTYAGEHLSHTQCRERTQPAGGAFFSLGRPGSSMLRNINSPALQAEALQTSTSLTAPQTFGPTPGCRALRGDLAPRREAAASRTRRMRAAQKAAPLPTVRMRTLTPATLGWQRPSSVRMRQRCPPQPLGASKRSACAIPPPAALAGEVCGDARGRSAHAPGAGREGAAEHARRSAEAAAASPTPSRGARGPAAAEGPTASRHQGHPPLPPCWNGASCFKRTVAPLNSHPQR